LYLFLLALTSGKIIAEKLGTIPRPAATKLTYANHPFARGQPGLNRPGLPPKRRRRLEQIKWTLTRAQAQFAFVFTHLS
jgi:hypothetical protein